MKTLAMIEMDYNRAMSLAAELERLGNQVKKQANEAFPGVITNVQSAWQGENADEYVKKAYNLQPQMLTASDSLYNVASTIRTVAQNTYNAEMTAYWIAHRRTY